MALFDNVAVVGVGLIGGSIGMALLERGVSKRVIGIGRRQGPLRTARRVGAVTNTTVDLTKGVVDADFIVVCTPVGLIADHVQTAARHAPHGTLITDTGSTKQSIIKAVPDELPRGSRFLGSHPLAGAEKSGPANASADLFEGKIAIVTPDTVTRAEDYDRVAEFWQSLGAVVVRMSAAEHDRVIALSSHLPHVVAVALAATLPEEGFRMAGGGFLDTTRVASSGTNIWMHIFRENRECILAALDRFDENLAELRGAIERGDEREVEHILTVAKTTRDSLTN